MHEKDLAQLEKEIKALENRRIELFQLRAPIDEEILESYQQLSELKEQKNEILAETKSDDWDWLLETDEYGSSTKGNVLNQKLQEIGLSSSGYFPETLQSVIRISLIKGESKSLEKTIAGLRIILPFIKPLKTGFRHVDIFEHTLSQYCSLDLFVSDTEYWLARQVRPAQQFPDLETAIAYIQENVWYEKVKHKKKPSSR